MQYINGRQDKPVREILDKGKYKGYRYVIISFGTHPCAYVEALFFLCHIIYEI